MKKLIIFVDGFPWSDASHIDGIDFIRSSFPMVPSYGYSVNLHHELFAGKSPDDLGFFGDANRKELINSSPPWFLKLLDWFRLKLPFISRVTYKIVSKLFKKPMAFLPPSLLSKFEFSGGYLLQLNDSLEIGGTNFEVICFDTKLKFGERDYAALERGKELIDDAVENLIVAFTELDWVFHVNGFRSTKYNQKISTLTSQIKQLGDYYLSKFPDGEVVVVSDHGMTDTKESINFQLEKRFGMPFSNGVSYFYDSLYLSLWNDGNEKLFNKMIGWLSNQDCGHFIEDKEREKYKLSDRNFGDKIYLLNEGFGFSPNYFGYRSLKAYHGYAPSVDSMKGVYCSSKDHPDKSIHFTTRDVYEELSAENISN